MSAALDVALSLAASGIPVFPCARDKRPAIPAAQGGHGFHDASSDPDSVRQMFGQYGDLVGAPTGEITGFDVLDLDYRHGAGEWEETNAARLPETRIHQTQSGGRHYLFRHAPGVRNTAGKVGPGVDVRGEGGYVIMPPSAGYSVISDAEIAEWPDWLLDLVLSKPPAPHVRVNGYNPGVIESRRLDGFIRSITDRVGRAPEGGKHFALRNAALSLGGIQHAAGLSDEQATQMLIAALPASVRDWVGAAKTIAWGLDRGRSRPIELDERRPEQSDPRPSHTDDPGWWHSLEARMVEDAEVEAEVYSDPAETSAEPPQDDPDMDGRVISPHKDWLAPAPLREWIIEGWIPRGYVTGLYGDGGTGKSLLAQQLLTSVALALPWIGFPVRGGRAFGMMCEDDNKELHRRQEAINRSYSVEMGHLENLRLAPRLGCDNLLMTFDMQNRPLLTDLFADLCKILDDFPPTLVVLDTLADIFGGNEVSRTHARAFVQGVGGRIARRWNCAVVIPAHPSASGLATGSGTSGSTAWNNTFRSRIYMTRPPEDDADADGDLRQINRKKANYAPQGGEVTVRWEAGAFVPQGPGGGKPATKRIEWSDIDTIFNEIDRAWKADDSWSSAPQTRKDGRYLPLWAQVHLGLNEKLVAKYLNDWLAGGYLKAEIIDGKTKSRGLRVMRRLQPGVAAEVGGSRDE